MAGKHASLLCTVRMSLRASAVTEELLQVFAVCRGFLQEGKNVLRFNLLLTSQFGGVHKNEGTKQTVAVLVL